MQAKRKLCLDEKYISLNTIDNYTLMGVVAEGDTEGLDRLFEKYSIVANEIRGGEGYSTYFLNNGVEVAYWQWPTGKVYRVK